MRQLTMQEVADRYQCQRQTIMRRVNRGSFPAPTGKWRNTYTWDPRVLDEMDNKLVEKSRKSYVVHTANI